MCTYVVYFVKSAANSFACSNSNTWQQLLVVVMIVVLKSVVLVVVEWLNLPKCSLGLLVRCLHPRLKMTKSQQNAFLLYKTNGTDSLPFPIHVTDHFL